MGSHDKRGHGDAFNTAFYLFLMTMYFSMMMVAL